MGLEHGQGDGSMDLDLTEEHDMLREMVRGVCEQ